MKQKIMVVFFITLLTVSLLSAAEYEQKIARRFELSPAGSIELSSVNGEIVVSSSGTAVDIKAVKRSDHKGEIENVEVLFEQNGDRLRVKTVHHKRNSRAKVDFIVTIPEKLARAVFNSVNGRIDCSGKFADLTLKTVNGKVDFQGQFRAGVFETVNGPIEIVQEPLLGGNLEANTVNGSIDIELNRNSAFEVEGSTVNGRIDSDFDLRISRHFVGKSMSGKVNGGGFRVEVETVNGSIDISKI